MNQSYLLVLQLFYNNVLQSTVFAISNNALSISSKEVLEQFHEEIKEKHSPEEWEDFKKNVQAYGMEAPKDPTAFKPFLGEAPKSGDLQFPKIDVGIEVVEVDKSVLEKFPNFKLWEVAELQTNESV